MASRRKTTKRTQAPASSDADHIAELYGEIYRVVRTIPRGRVATYGQVAELAGRPGAARAVGAAMRACPAHLGLPWQRVVGKRGAVAKVSILDPVGAAIQRAILEKEGVRFSSTQGISLETYGWLPTDGPRKRKPAAKTKRR